MRFERRLVSLLIVLAVLGAPAVGLRLICAGRSCDEPVRSTVKIPFCSLDKGLRELIAAGYREGPSPDVLAVASRPVSGGSFFKGPGPRPSWLSGVAARSTRVPIAFQAPGVESLPAEAPAGTTHDDIAPTLAEIMGLQRPHPEVRSGQAVVEAPGGSPPALVLQVVWKGVGSDALEEQPDAWPTAAGLVDGFGTMEGRTGALPADPAAVLTTIGTGGIPAQHGITGSLVRDDSGDLQEAWSQKAPISVIAGLGDHADELTAQKARMGMVTHDPTDRGLSGGSWYVNHDDDDFTVSRRPRQIVTEVQGLLDDGYGRDEVPDLLAVTLHGSTRRMDDLTRRIIDAAAHKVGRDDLAIAFTSTGGAAPRGALPGARAITQVQAALSADVVDASAPGGVYLDQDVVAREEITDDVIIEALEGVNDEAGRPLFEDVFPAIAVSFGRYC